MIRIHYSEYQRSSRKYQGTTMGVEHCLSKKNEFCGRQDKPHHSSVEGPWWFVDGNGPCLES